MREGRRGAYRRPNPKAIVAGCLTSVLISTLPFPADAGLRNRSGLNSNTSAPYSRSLFNIDLRFLRMHQPSHFLPIPIYCSGPEEGDLPLIRHDHRPLRDKVPIVHIVFRRPVRNTDGSYGCPALRLHHRRHESGELVLVFERREPQRALAYRIYFQSIRDPQTKEDAMQCYAPVCLSCSTKSASNSS